MSVDVVSDIEPRVQYTAAAAQTDFDYPFPIFADADLVVDVDGVTQALTTDYTVTGAGDDTGGTITFLSAMAGSEVVTIYRDLAIERLTDFQQNGRFSSASFNDELDKIIMIQQQLDAAVKRALRLSNADTVSDAAMQLPVAASRADKFLYFNAQGEPEMATAVTAGTVLSQSTVGAVLYPISAAETAAGLVSGDLTLYYVYGDVRRYGTNTAPGTTDMSAAITAAISCNSLVHIPAGAYKINSPIALVSGLEVYGDGVDTIISVAADINAFVGSADDDVVLRDFKISAATSTANTSGVHLTNCDRVHCLRLDISGFSYNGVIGTGGTTYLTVEHCYFHGFVNMVQNSADISFYNNCTFSKALFNRCESGTDFGVCFELDSTDNLAHGNTISGCGRYGILAGYETTPKTVRNRVTVNLIKDISGSQLISGSATAGAGIYAVSVGEITIANNIIENTNTATTTETLAPAGIGINGNYGPVHVEGNLISACDWYGIMVVNDAFSQPVNVVNNTIRDCVKTGIYAKNHGNVTISGNQISNTSTAAVDGIFAYGLDADITHVQITDNWLRGGSGGMANGVRLEGVNEFTVSGNHVEESQGYGVTMTNCDDGALGPNTVRAAVTAGIRFNGCNRVHASGGHYASAGTNSVVGAGTGATNLLDNAYITPFVVSNASTAGLAIIGRTTAAPGAGTWNVGDTVYHLVPASAGNIGSVCTTAGTPGTWKTFGVIA